MDENDILTGLDYSRDVRIDETALDVECLRQSSLTFRYNQAVAFYEKVVAKRKEELDIQKAKLTKRIHKAPADFKLDKVTVDTVNAAILTHPSYMDLNNKYIEDQYELKMVRAAVDGLRDKKSMLELLVKLHGQSYFAGPSLPRDLHREMEEYQGVKVNKKIKIKPRNPDGNNTDDI